MAMRTGECIAFSLESWTYNSIRNCAYNVGISKSRKYSVHFDREANECKVTRHA